ncbi:MAG: hypothetical protein K2I93_02790 [Oscillospiraceae bacterium]|nr:hypothetical protein [Oscillospiraceae bacterium]
MLTTQQIDNLQGIVCNYDSYVVYYYGDYHTYTGYEERDSRIYIYCGDADSITFNAGTFTFTDTVECYTLTYGKYLNSAETPSSFTIPHSEMVYTNLVPNYPQLCYFESRFQNADIGKWIIIFAVGSLMIDVVFKVIFGGKDS